MIASPPKLLKHFFNASSAALRKAASGPCKFVVSPGCMSSRQIGQVPSNRPLPFNKLPSAFDDPFFRMIPSSLLSIPNTIFGEARSSLFPSIFADNNATNNLMKLPFLDAIDTPTHYKVKVELPGMNANDINISVKNDILSISGFKKQETEQKDETKHIIECSYGQFYRKLALPEGADAGKIEAQLNNGVLEIKWAKKAESVEGESTEGKRIPIFSGSGESTGSSQERVVDNTDEDKM